ncbi:MAG TPA: 2,3-bisphosphoglycerate-independent phosphoglycerate mutase [Gammaproteobacteria bacterium]|nr:2,3-bisphosphoglycerate-independent phosphoglycerate mutase [Gammaproteobacteria bacterium]
MHRPRPFALIILDGWGHREEPSANAIAQAKKPHWDSLLANHPHTLISGCGACVGLPDGQMGNSEVGHLNMGAGRIVHQDLTRIDLAIKNGEFFINPILTSAVDQAVKSKQAIHILGLLSPGGVHSHEEHIQAMIKLAHTRGASKVYFHAFLDGRDTPPKSAKSSLSALEKYCSELKCGKIVSLIGRFYAMDRDKRWERIEKTYDLLTQGKALFHVKDAVSGLELAYQRGETDEFVKATSIHAEDASPIFINDNDTVIFMNFRADRAREITRALTDKNFNGFTRKIWPKIHFVTLTEYDSTFDVKIAYPPERLDNILGQYLSSLNLQQLRIAETEKYAHVTFFFNGGIEHPYPGEDRILIPSPHVLTYDLKPEMSAYEVTDALIKAIESQKYDVIICNFANPDMVGHTGNLPAAIQAIETIDTCLGKIIPALKKAGGEALITADHGNAEMMFDDKTGQPHTAHTHEWVPLVYVGSRPAKVNKKNGILSDIAPTMLYLMGLAQPQEMTGETIFKWNVHEIF